MNNGVEMPIIGYGVFQVSPEEAARCVEEAIGVGYRSIDTAQAYYNEEGVGKGIKNSDVSRGDLFLTTKVWITNAGEEKALTSIDESLRKLQTDYIDLLLIHQHYNDYYGTYRAMEKALKQGKVRAIGLSNFEEGRFTDLAAYNEITPAVLQLQTNVFNQQTEMQEFLKPYGTQLMAWSPLTQGRKETSLPIRCSPRLVRSIIRVWHRWPCVGSSSVVSWPFRSQPIRSVWHRILTCSTFTSPMMT